MQSEASRLLSELNFSVTTQQKEIIGSVIDPSKKMTLVSAGAGSGKTHVSVGALLALLKGRGVKVDEIVLITFTNEAANNLRGRLAEEFDAQLTRASQEGEISSVEFWLEQQERIANTHIGTIHSFCSRVLKEFGYDLGISKNAEIKVGTELRKQAIEQQIDELLKGSKPHFLPEGSGLKDYETVNLIDSVIEHYGNLGFDSAAVLKATKNKQSKDPFYENRVATAQLVHNALYTYRRDKEQQSCLDSHDLIGQTLRLIKSDPNIKKRLGVRYRYLFVDEFQDTDKQQINIVEELRDDLAHVLLVGDTKQAIYGFRGATSNSLGNVADKNGVSCFELNYSGRAAQSLLDAQNALFEHIEAAEKERFSGINQPLKCAEYPRDTYTLPAKMPSILHIKGQDSESATELAIKRLLSHTYIKVEKDTKHALEKQVTHDDIVVLVRTNEQAKSMFNYLNKQGVAVSLSSGESIFAEKEITDTQKVLECIFSYPDSASILNVMTTSYWVNHNEHDDCEVALPLHLTEQFIAQEIKKKFDQSKVGKIILELSEKSKYLSVIQLIEELYNEFQVRERCYADNDTQAVFNLDYLLSFANSLTMDSASLSLPVFIDTLATKINSGAEVKGLPQGVTSEAKGKVAIMTVHRSKGDEFKFVIVPYMERNANTGTRPQFIVDQEYGLDINLFGKGDKQKSYSEQFTGLAEHHTKDLLPEEMRNFYVAVTRAELQLLLICGDDSELKEKSNYYSWQTAYDKACAHAQKKGSPLVTNNHRQVSFVDGELKTRQGTT
ncbi:UvrD-helicase domain-containing protein [Vibrio alginolyticus]|uniref:UvrD-helicase domain-containing protein n=1 Tax=Vibrio alginolyticus TaxID=663 RepID=UPI00215FEA09|nr:ATP-dependent helicase [Vibrio alginolyticus]MCS0173691.1 ATP-dependent helicase [Vibrio alginolyticus]